MEAKQEREHRHTGVYGVCVSDQRLLVIRKRLGPYSGQYDLPGGRLEPSESLEQAVMREFREETGTAVRVVSSIGVCDFQVLWTLKDRSTERLHHIAMLYQVEVDRRAEVHPIEAFPEQDSDGAVWLPPEEIEPRAASPAVLQAVEWLRSHRLSVARSLFDYRT
ncbi:NUDIX hydrolase [Paenibacillus antri]|uniref:NUDIX hydrolase n=1 Tax=Paenibacillus antri TaxID=2582848 RepID=A0A5R9G4M6_9BACL|nr:NUDIX hydrolase [Paenibacillus antri]TLS50731.1 NUDIX hydrolase [Paenibacillus antri]